MEERSYVIRVHAHVGRSGQEQISGQPADLVAFGSGGSLGSSRKLRSDWRKRSAALTNRRICSGSQRCWIRLTTITMPSVDPLIFASGNSAMALVLRAAEGAVANIGAVADSGVCILGGVEGPMPLVIGTAGAALHAPTVIAPRTFAPVNSRPVAMMVVVGVELTHDRPSRTDKPILARPLYIRQCRHYKHRYGSLRQTTRTLPVGESRHRDRCRHHLPVAVRIAVDGHPGVSSPVYTALQPALIGGTWQGAGGKPGPCSSYALVSILRHAEQSP